MSMRDRLIPCLAALGVSVIGVEVRAQRLLQRASALVFAGLALRLVTAQR